MQNIPAKLHLSDILNSKIVIAEGKVLSHVADISLTLGPEYKITGLLYGWRGWIYRLHDLSPLHDRKELPHLLNAIPWQAIESIENATVELKPGFRTERKVKG